MFDTLAPAAPAAAVAAGAAQVLMANSPRRYRLDTSAVLHHRRLIDKYGGWRSTVSTTVVVTLNPNPHWLCLLLLSLNRAAGWGEWGGFRVRDRGCVSGTRAVELGCGSCVLGHWQPPVDWTRQQCSTTGDSLILTGDGVLQ